MKCVLNSQLCSALVARIAVVFAQNFDYAISRSQDVRQSQQAEQDGQHDECCFNARHAVVAVCCLFDYGFLSCRLFVQVIRRVLGNENSQSICEFRIELLILLLRLGAGKLRQNSSSLFLSVWKEIHASLELQGERDACHKNHEQSSRFNTVFGYLFSLLTKFIDSGSTVPPAYIYLVSGMVVAP